MHTIRLVCLFKERCFVHANIVESTFFKCIVIPWKWVIWFRTAMVWSKLHLFLFFFIYLPQLIKLDANKFHKYKWVNNWNRLSQNPPFHNFTGMFSLCFEINGSCKGSILYYYCMEGTEEKERENPGWNRGHNTNKTRYRQITNHWIWEPVLCTNYLIEPELEKPKPKPTFSHELS